MADSPRSKEEQREFNPRWKGYVYMLVASLVNFASISNLDVDRNPEFNGAYQFSLVFGISTFGLAAFILVTDRFQACCSKDFVDKYNYTKAMDGKLEGYTLLACTFWWIVGVAHITQVDGIAYVATNIYFSSWLTLIACIYTLDKWSAAKDILSIQELTGLSATLKSWYLLFLASLVTMGTSCDMHIHLAEQYRSSAAYGIALGLVSSLVALSFILIHYRIIDFEFLQVGGWIELSASFCMILVWMVGVSILTSEGGVAATMGGSGCAVKEDVRDDVGFGENCYMVWTNEDSRPSDDDLLQETPRPTEAEKNAPTKGPTDPPIQLPETDPPVEAPMELPTQSPSIQQAGAGGVSTEVPTISESEGEIAGNQVTPAPSEFLTEASSTPTQALSESQETASPTANQEPTTEAPTSTLQPGADENNENAVTEPELDLPGNVTQEDDADADDEDLTDDALLDADTGFDDDSLIPIDNDTTLFNSTSNLTIEDDADPTRWLQEELATSINATTANATPIPIPIPTREPAMPVRTRVPTNAPTYLPYVERVSCGDILDQQVPGSNLYLSCWICFFASFNITLRWKAAQAIQFAQAQTRKADEQERLREEDVASERDADDDDDVDGDDDEEDNL